MGNVNTDWLWPKRQWYVLPRTSLIGGLVFLATHIPCLAKTVNQIITAIYDFHPTERIVEYAFVHEKIPFNGKGKKVLDIGSGASGLSLELASKGYHVYALDVNLNSVLPFVKHPNLEFIRGDIRKTLWEDAYFDFITCVSVLEHIGPLENTKDDMIALQEIRRILKNDGQLILTVPFGIKSIHTHQGWFSADYGRIYDQHSLVSILTPLFNVVDIQYAMHSCAGWKPASLEEVRDVDSSMQSKWKSALAIAMVVASPKRCESEIV